jgi:uncharacterized protein YjbJ (UPF0337 family)
MSAWEKAKATVQGLFGRAEEVYGQSHGDAAATVSGEANRLEAEAELEAEQRREHPDDDGLAGAR